MITLQSASETPEFQSKIGKFSHSMSMLVDQMKAPQENNNVKFGKAQISKPQVVAKNAITSNDISGDGEDNKSVILEEELNTENLGLVEYIFNNAKWVKKFLKVNFLSATLHISLLLFFRELSKKQR
jgi:hypothetical protein